MPAVTQQFADSVHIWSNVLLVVGAILSRDEEYSARLLEALRESVLGQVDLTQMERLTSKIYTLTGLYTTYLLNKG